MTLTALILTGYGVGLVSGLIAWMVRRSLR